MKIAFGYYLGGIVLFIILIIFSFQNIEQSYSPLKYNGPHGLEQLLSYYNEYKTNFESFLKDTYAFHTGSTPSSQSSFYFLYPLFIISDLFGGISYANLYRATIIFGLFSIIILFLFLKNFWDIKIAFLSCLFYGFSPWFQELFRSGTYFGPSNLIALLILYVVFRLIFIKHSNSNMLVFALGLLLGISWYYYGMLRGLIFFVLVMLWQEQKTRIKNIFLCFMGMLTVLTWGICLRLYESAALFDHENFLTIDNPWVSLLKRFFLIFYQIFTPNVIQAVSPSHYAHHARLLQPLLFIPFVLGLLISIIKKDKNYKFFNFYSLILYLSVIITSNCQVRRLSLLIIPVYVYAGIGAYYISIFLNKVKGMKLSIFLKISGIITIIFIVMSQILYSKKHILEAERTYGFLRVAQEIKRQSIKGDILLLMDLIKIKYSEPYLVKSINDEVRDEVFIKIENYKDFSSGKIRIKTIDSFAFQRILFNNKYSRFYLITTPLNDSKAIGDLITSKGWHISEKAKIEATPPLRAFLKENDIKMEDDYFKIISVWK